LSTGKIDQNQVQIKGVLKKKPLGIIHTDICRPTRTKGLNGEQYFMLMIDDYTRMTAVFFLKKKSREFEHFKIYKEMVEIDKYLKIKCLISNNGGEFTTKEFMDFCGEHGIKRKFSAARTPQKK
jgi:transposase InsO family protein